MRGAARTEYRRPNQTAVAIAVLDDNVAMNESGSFLLFFLRDSSKVR